MNDDNENVTVADVAAAVEKNNQLVEEHLEKLSGIESKVAKLEKQVARSRYDSPAGNASAPPMSAEERSALDLGVRALFRGDQGGAMQAFKSMSAGSSPEGGFLVVSTFSHELTKIMLDISPFGSLARTVELQQGSVFEEVVDRNAAETSWVGETTPSPRAETATPALGLFRCETAELCAYPKITQKLIDTAAIDPVQWLQAKVAEAFAYAEGLAFHTGDGVARPRGILTYPTSATPDATRTWGTLEHIATGASGAFATATTTVSPADVLIKTVGALRQQYRRNARWLLNRTTAAAVRTFKDTVGRFLWVDSLVPGQPDSLLGYPVVIDENMPDVGANSLSIAFGDFEKGFTVIRRLGVRFLVDPYSQPPYVKLHSYERVGGGVNNFEAIKLVKFASA